MQQQEPGRPVTVLYVEDEDADAFFMRWAFEREAPGLRLVHVVDGRQAIAYLEGKPPFNDRPAYPLPALVILDLKLPGHSGFEVLAWVREQPGFQSLPVVVFSSSGLEADRQKAQGLGASGYMQKPASVWELCQWVQSLRARWGLGD